MYCQMGTPPMSPESIDAVHAAAPPAAPSPPASMACPAPLAEPEPHPPHPPGIQLGAAPLPAPVCSAVARPVADGAVVLQLRPLPDVASFPVWRTDVLLSLTAASPDPDLVAQWSTNMCDDGVPFDALRNSGGPDRLEAALASALFSVLKPGPLLSLAISK